VRFEGQAISTKPPLKGDKLCGRTEPQSLKIGSCDRDGRDGEKVMRIHLHIHLHRVALPTELEICEVRRMRT
jgi:hypothetical protein